MIKNIQIPDDKAFIHKLKQLAINSYSVKAYLEAVIKDHVLNTNPSHDYKKVISPKEKRQ